MQRMTTVHADAGGMFVQVAPIRSEHDAIRAIEDIEAMRRIYWPEIQMASPVRPSPASQ